MTVVALFAVLGQVSNTFDLTPRQSLELKLFECVSSADTAGVRALLRKGVSPNAYEPRSLMLGHKVPPLAIAVGQHELEIATILLKAGADPNVRYSPSGKVGTSPLLIAIGVNDAPCASLLLRYGADLRAKNDRNEDAERMAKRLGRTDILKLLKRTKK